MGTTCAPTRAGLHTGHYCNSAGVWHTIGGRSLLREDEWTLATALSAEGYACSHFGKWRESSTTRVRFLCERAPSERGFFCTGHSSSGPSDVSVCEGSPDLLW